MITKSITTTRNAQRTGKNCMSYNAKHPESTLIVLKPIRAACARTHKDDHKTRRRLRALANLSRPNIMLEIAYLSGWI